jgi:hypothetical protein
MDLSTIASLGVIVLSFGLLVHYLLEPLIRKSLINMVFFALAILLVLSSFKMLYTGEIVALNV